MADPAFLVGCLACQGKKIVFFGVRSKKRSVFSSLLRRAVEPKVKSKRDILWGALGLGDRIGGSDRGNSGSGIQEFKVRNSRSGIREFRIGNSAIRDRQFGIGNSGIQGSGIREFRIGNSRSLTAEFRSRNWGIRVKNSPELLVQKFGFKKQV